MTETHGSEPATEGVQETHGESHASMSDQNSRRKSRVDTSAEFAQVRNSRGAQEKVTRPLPRKLTFSGLPLGRPEREIREGERSTNPPEAADREPVGPIAEEVPERPAAQQTDDDLAAHRQAALDRLRRQTPAIRTRKEPS